MKDIYEYFNEINIDPSELAEAEVDELEKARVKKMVREKIAQTSQPVGLKKRWRKSKAMVAVAAITIMLAGISGFGLAFPVHAKEVPVVGDIFRFLDGGRTGVYDLYQESALDINMIKADNGIELTLNQGVYDGRTLALTYTIKTKEDLGEELYVRDHLHVRGVTGMTGGAQVRRVSPGVYVGQNNYSFPGEKVPRDTLSFRWSVSGVSSLGRVEQEIKTIDCRLNYSVALKTLAYKEVMIEKNQDRVQNVAVSAKQLSLTPINTILHYSEISPNNLSRSVQLDWKIKDDLGNVYEYEGNGGQGQVGAETTEMEYSITFKPLDPKAKTLLITPTLKLYPTKGGGVSIDENGKETHFTNEGLPKGVTAGEWTMQQITVDLSTAK
ncbi:DUF4179 domain-containing protein [Desulfotomaculum sp. 1211_IL3151]|uniref:DUF4179 domain-containing protein n=1 Tax=Desulfotomaculum sp. 1211_IL3151 TaxID=3084055 RepID=UPI002FD8A2ED